MILVPLPTRVMMVLASSGVRFLRLVNDHELVRNAASANVTQRLDDDAAGTHEIAAAAMVVPHVQVAQHFERVVNRLHPRREFFLERPGQKPQFLAHRNRRARDDEPAEFAVDYGALQSGGHGEQRFSGAGLAHERDEFNAVVEQRVKGEMLFAVAGLDAPDPSRQSMMGISFVPVASTLVSAVRLGFVSSVSGSIRSEILFAGVQAQFAVGAERGPFYSWRRTFPPCRCKGR